MAQFVTIVREVGTDPGLVAEIAGRMQMGRTCSDLVQDGRISQSQLEVVRRAVVDHWQDAQRTSDPAYHVTKEYARLEAIADCAAHCFELTTGYNPAGLRRDQLPGADRPNNPSPDQSAAATDSLTSDSALPNTPIDSDSLLPEVSEGDEDRANAQNSRATAQDSRGTEDKPAASLPAHLGSASPHHYLKLMLDTSRERRKLLGVNAPERKVVVHADRPQELLQSIFADMPSPSVALPE